MTQTLLLSMIYYSNQRRSTAEQLERFKNSSHSVMLRPLMEKQVTESISASLNTPVTLPTGVGGRRFESLFFLFDQALRNILVKQENKILGPTPQSWKLKYFGLNE